MTKKIFVYVLLLTFIFLVKPWHAAAQEPQCPEQIVQKQLIYVDETGLRFGEEVETYLRVGKEIKWGDVNRARFTCSNITDWYDGSICDPFPKMSIAEYLGAQCLFEGGYIVIRANDGTWPAVQTYDEARELSTQPNSENKVKATSVERSVPSDPLIRPISHSGPTGALLPPPTLYALLALLALGSILAGGLFLWRSKHLNRGKGGSKAS